VAAPIKLCFVGPSRGNHYMNELLAAVAHTVRAEGVDASLLLDAVPPTEESTVYVVIPHEYFPCAPVAGQLTREQLARTISFCVEQPGTPWFEVSCFHAARTAAVVDIQRSSLKALHRRGLAAEHFRLGYCDLWDRWGGDEQVERPTDVLHLGKANERRHRLLASYAHTLWPRETRLLVPPEDPKTQRRADYLMEDEKWRCLRSAKTILNIHRQPTAFFEWARVLEAIANGCVVVSEHSADGSPLVAGEHYISGHAENLALLAGGLLEDEDRLRAIRRSAYDFVRSELSMQPSAHRLIALAEEVRRSARRPSARRLLARDRELADPTSDAPAQTPASGLMGHLGAKLRGLALRDPWVRSLVQSQTLASERATKQIAAIKRLALADLDTKRTLRAHQLAARGEDPDALRTVARTPAYGRAEVRVSVITPVHNHAVEVQRALRSVLRTSLAEVEVVVLDDASSDGSADSVVRFFEANPSLPAILLQHPVNRGVGAARNALARQARGEFIFALDADNEMYPPALGRLVSKLEEDAEAAFAYSMLEEVREGKPAGLRCALPWEPERLRRDNYIDAMALVRRRDLLGLGGYTEDLRLHGWEDYDLWCRFADRGRRGAFVPQILGRYHRSEYSMLTVTDIDDAETKWLLRKRNPRLMEAEPIA